MTLPGSRQWYLRKNLAPLWCGLPLERKKVEYIICYFLNGFRALFFKSTSRATVNTGDTFHKNAMKAQHIAAVGGSLGAFFIEACCRKYKCSVKITWKYVYDIFRKNNNAYEITNPSLD